MNADVTFAPKQFYKATIEKVTLKPKSKNFGITSRLQNVIKKEEFVSFLLMDVNENYVSLKFN